MNTTRKYWLDYLKVFLTLLVIFHHAGQAYEGGDGSWPYQPSNPEEIIPWIWHFFCTNAAFFMGLFFFISGYFIPSSYDRNGAKIFIRKKLLRLGLPLLIVGGALSIATGTFELAHLWFIESLLVFCLIYALIRQWVKPIEKDCKSKPTIIGLTIVSLLVGVGSFFIRKVSPQDNWVWPFGIIPLPIEPAHYLQYVVMFVLGILAFRFKWLDRMSNRTGAISLTLGLLLVIGNYLRAGGPWNAFVWRWFGIYESFLCFFLSFGLMWLFREYADVESRFLKWCSAQSYGVYIIHLPLIIAVQYIFDGVKMGAVGKFLFIGTVATVVSFLLTWLYNIAVKTVKNR